MARHRRRRGGGGGARGPQASQTPQEPTESGTDEPTVDAATGEKHAGDAGDAGAPDAKRPRSEGGGRNRGYGARGTGQADTNVRSWDTLVKDNEMFETYYKAQHFVGDDEWAKFMETLRTPLPSTFRITGTRTEAAELRQLLHDRFFVGPASAEDAAAAGAAADVRPPTPAVPIPWYPDSLGWTMRASRVEMRRARHLEDLRQYLVMQTELGYISRQEAVSMVPPLLLDVRPGHKVLDMCAAPGSKTAQLIELVHGDSSSSPIPNGLVIANDADMKRAFVLIHQTQRLQSPAVLVTNHDASQFPTITLNKIDEATGRPQQLLFDRILADVPCSGDATLRKNPLIWRKWSPTFGLGLHKLQVRILERALQLCTVGGRVVYSTCSFNPIENEAVVAAMLEKYPGCIELVDVSDKLPELQRRPGLTQWQVMNKKGEILASYDAVPKGERSHLHPTMFCSTATAQLPLQRCLRIVPHDQDTGGFFVAVIHKAAPLKAVAAAPPPPAKPSAAHEAASTSGAAPPAPDAAVAEPAADNAAAAAAPPADDADNEDVDDVPLETLDGESVTVAGKTDKEGQGGKKKKTSAAEANAEALQDAPYNFFEADSPIFDRILKAYQLRDSFPRNLLLTRTDSERKNHIYLVSAAVREVLQSPELKRLRILQTGLRVFVRNEGHGANASGMRVLQEALPYLGPYLQSGRISVGPKDLHLLLQSEHVALEYISPELAAQVRPKPYGSIFFEYDPKKYPDVPCYLSGPLLMCGWRGHKTTQLLVNKKERARMLALFNTVLITPPPNVGKAPAAKRAGSEAPSADDQPEAAGDATPAESVAEDAMPVEDVAAA